MEKETMTIVYLDYHERCECMADAQASFERTKMAEYVPACVLGDPPPELACSVREYFARAPGSDVWVAFDDLPEATVKAPIEEWLAIRKKAARRINP
jgi:hypothetical protein